MNKSIQTECDECGKRNIKIHRNDAGHRYCTTCYARVFKSRPCPRCNELKRLPVTNPEAICSTCKKSRPCVRCGRLDFSVGLITDYGPVCNACSPHFRLSESCQGCGKPSSELSKINRLGGQLRLCRSCQRVDYETCPQCRRYRLLIDVGNERMCKRCAEVGEIPCTGCGQLMPGGRVSKCENCYWNETATKRISMNEHSFSSPKMTMLFHDFGQWLIRECGAKNAALSIHRYLAFFVDVERIWGEFPSYTLLVNHFKAEGLRRVRRPMRWLAETTAITVDCETRENTSEESRIAKSLMAFSADTFGAKAISGYEKKLRIRMQEGKTSVKSIRLALTPALHLLQASDKGGKMLPDQQSLDRYLLKAPGQKAAVTGFINYLNMHYSLALEIKINRAATEKLRRKKLESNLSNIVATNGLTLDNFDEWVIIALHYFHGVKIPSKALNKLRASVQSSDPTGIAVIFNNKTYHLPIYFKSMSNK